MGVGLLQRCVLFEGLPREALEEAQGEGRRVVRVRGECFFQQGEPARHAYVLLSGRVKLQAVHPDGRVVIHRTAGPGEVFGGLALLGEQTYPVSAEAWEVCEALAWTGEQLRQMALQHPQLALNLLRMAAERVRDLQARVEELVADRVERRIARAVLRLVRQAGRRTAEGVLIDLPLSREDLANLTGTTLFTVSRVLSRWEERGIVAAGRQRLVVRVPHAFAEIAEDLEQPPNPSARPG
ncbi:MAG: Crp/Fnr family transcriptional regulator [Armatimonadota bacterium]|nr:Crp/Fnr family transcriptional regulator [Armatimonadota bacterium]MDR5674805.1 Crp/Fnr family transcriptional regulator [Armatimonadota bacterium]MDR5688197.1 Crp/Fnr family transcriptional regulator [Armatimonadota bacterium]MDR7387441.1 Crp/Fnr family transcriptional regulator [Armatimonadota bacterium]MDR7388173.1 Crp/Fnr family transcriptional regulator [Armatimonadota bacterium]